MSSQRNLLLTIGLLAAPVDVDSFTIPTAQHTLTIRGKQATSTVLFAATQNYLDSLSAIVEKQSGGFMTEDYLSGLSPVTEVSPEEFLMNLPAQLAEVARATGTEMNLGGSFYLADAELQMPTPDVVSDTVIASSAAAPVTDIISDTVLASNAAAPVTDIISDTVLASNAAAPVADTINSVSSVGEAVTNSIASAPVAVADAISSASVGDAVITNSLTAQLSEKIPFGAMEAASNNLAESLPSEFELSDSLSSQLSGLSYGSFVDEKATKATKASADFAFDQMSGGPSKFSEMSADISGKIGASMNGLFGKVSSSLEASTNKIAQAGSSSVQELETVVKAVPKVVETGAGNIASTVAQRGAVSANAVSASLNAEKAAFAQSLNAEKAVIAQSTSKTVETVGKETLSDLGNGVIHAIKVVAAFFVQVLDSVLKELLGTTTGELIHIAKVSVDTAVSGAVNSVTHTVSDIGNMTMSQMIQNLVGLVVMITKFILTVLNAVVKLLSGKEASEWALAATTTVTQKAGELTSLASSTATDLTHRSFAELVSSVDSFSTDVGKQLIEGAGVLTDAVSTQLATDGGAAFAGSTIDGVASALQASQML